jgi:hypothetical protein
MFMLLTSNQSKRNLTNIPNKILQLLEICLLRLVKLFGLDIYLRKLLDQFINSQRLLSLRMNFKLNLLVIILLDLNLRFMNNGSLELGVKKLKEQKLVFKLHLL